MSITAYIESLTKIDETKSVNNVAWSRVTKEKVKSKPHLQGKGELPFQFELEQTDQSNSCQKDKKYSEEKKAHFYEKHHNTKIIHNEYRFADIIPRVREVGGGYNTFSNQAIERRFRENQSKHASAEESDLSSTYVTATSKSIESSYDTTVETLGSLQLSSNESKHEVSSNENEQYKVDATMARSLHTQNNKSLDIDTCTDISLNRHNVSLERENEEENWDDDASDERMYKGRITRFFQSTEDEDVFEHPLKEQIKKDLEWQNYQLQRKGIKIIQTPRQYYLDLDDDDFKFE
ncbi:uncharacterized protein LOC131663536 [Phymastichus coffea]|uniref:uncharacterized protein LOC131663536 n=1 Tax=Phymastichus coffea TaxID=108790 RepID=UPI00273B68E2|nr:uncharacterized protein LOC131663536 [Phymastichus coffea]